MKPVTPADQMRATGSGRRKVALPPGRSQLDWVRNSLRIIPRSARTVPLSELRRHSKATDAWVAIDSQVFDVTPYIEYHPGGIDILVAVAGKDATKLFNKYHAWVNVNFMLKNCYVGMLDDDGDNAGDDGDDDDDDDESDESDGDDNDAGAAAKSDEPSTRGASSSRAST